MPRVFAFGTLKRGFPLHDQVMKGAALLGLCRTAKPFPMLVAGPRYAPTMLNEPGAGRHVCGELFAVDQRQLERIDAIESGIPGNGRVLIDLLAMDDKSIGSAFAYVKSRELAVPAHTGYLEAYRLDPRFIPPS